MKNRYPGVKPFETAEAGQFFGRQRDIQDLCELIFLEKLVVLFGKSGYGKSSILNAGVIPRLSMSGAGSKHSLKPLVLRFTSYTRDNRLTPVQVVAERISGQIMPDSGKSLWQYFRELQVVEPGQNYVLVFDQFEEFFTYPQEQQMQFRAQLAELLYTEIPQAIRDQWEFLSEEEKDQLSEPLDVRVVFAIREDRLSWLDSLKEELPAILHQRYELKGLSDEQAREAIVRPAALSQDWGFISPPFQFREEALETLLQELKKGGDQSDRTANDGRIEAFLLQICCENIERRMLEHQQMGKQATQVELSDLPRFDRIYEEYYNNKIAELPEGQQEAARRLIEDELVSINQATGVAFRINADGRKLSAMSGVTEALLKQLTDRFLLRAEPNTTGGFNYEISHDTLLAPVLKARDLRLAETRRLAEEQARLEKERELALERKKRRRARTYAIIGMVLAAAALVASVYAFFLRNRALAAQTRAETSALAAKAWRAYREDHTLAFRMAQAAWQMDTTNPEAFQTLLDIVNNPMTTFYQTGFFEHQFEVTAIAFSPDGKRMASGSFDTDIYVWNKNGAVLNYFPGKRTGENNPGHEGRVHEVFFSPGGDTLISAGGDGLLKLWDLNKGSFLREFSIQQSLQQADLSADGRLLLSAGDSTARLWNLQGRLLKTFPGHTGEVLACAIAPGNQFIVTGSADGTLRIWEMNGALRKVIILQGVKINDIDISSERLDLLVGCSDNSTRIYSADGTPLLILGGHTAEVSSVQFSPDGRFMLTGSYDRTVKLWSRNGRELLQLIGHQERIRRAIFSPDGRWAATGSWDFSAKLWNLDFNLQNKVNQHTNYANKVKVGPNGDYLLSGSADFTLKKWNFEGNLLSDMIGHTDKVTSLDISPDGRLFISTSEDKTVRLWRSDGRLFHLNDQFSGSVQQAVFSPDGKYYATAGLEGSLALWETESSRLIHRWMADTSGLQTVAFSPGGNELFSAGGSGMIRGWTLQGDSLLSLDNGGVPLWFIAVSPKGSDLLSAGVEYPVKRWQLKGKNELKKIFGHANENYHLAYSADGGRFVSSSWDHTARIWTLDGRLLHTLNHPDGVYGACFSPDGRLVVTACRDKIIRVWDSGSGRLINTIGSRFHPRYFTSSTEIADLSNIRFDWEQYGISPEIAAQMYGSRPENLVKRAINRLEKGIASSGNYQDGLRYFQEAERLLQLARRETGFSSDLSLDSLEAEVFHARADHFLWHGDFDQMARACREGLRRKDLDWLLILHANGLLLRGDYQSALAEAVRVKTRPVKQISFYNGMTIGEAIVAELVFYQDQYGINHPDIERFIASLQKE